MSKTKRKHLYEALVVILVLCGVLWWRVPVFLGAQNILF